MQDHPLSDDPEENLRMENELLRLKLKAELGAESHSMSNLHPDIENQFLKNVLAFEHNYAHSKPAKVYDLLGKPAFKKSEELSDDLIDGALDELINLMSEKNIEVYFGEGYDSRTQYQFITEELFDHESNFPPMPGMTTHFDYEEFHPNHQKDIERKARDFLAGWFKQSFNEHSWELADNFILPDRKILTKAQVLAQLKNIFEAYAEFTDEKYAFKDVGFQLDGDTGLGHAEGIVIYKAALENGETIDFKGPFKFYMSLEFGSWSIFHLIFPGFEY